MTHYDNSPMINLLEMEWLQVQLKVNTLLAYHRFPTLQLEKPTEPIKLEKLQAVIELFVR